METKRNYTPRQALIGKALQLIAMDFDDMIVNDDVLDHWEEMLSDIPDPIVLVKFTLTRPKSVLINPETWIGMLSPFIITLRISDKIPMVGMDALNDTIFSLNDGT